ncbi:unnamed protein product [Miscanthus lutarioriparius]|uniref:Uncharacterized protein n=1 Tax=Miscanthus lutarioriparius TaxID=422564 RepID=A0A811QHA7_9POAL|nr:unnamed protein product [Miscanthus lutarioriparius]
MEPPAAAWVPLDLQRSNWTMEYAGWAPGYPVESESTETFDRSWLQTSSGRQMVEHAAATDEDSIDKAAQEFEAYFQNMGVKVPINPIHVFEDAAREFKVDIDMMKMKIHMYPPSIKDFDNKFFTVPRLVAIGPYHHGQNQLKQAEKAKYVAAYHCIMESGHSVQDILYDKDVMAGISEDDFLHMMFYDACFLVQYFACTTDGCGTMDPSLRGFFDFNRKAIRHDIVLLQNQIPCAIELAENGIKLKANEETTELIHMGVNKRGIFAELSMAPLSLDDERASFLINMAALELCTTSNFQDAEPEDSAVCSEEDVQELRTKHLLQGGAGLINKDALAFFTRLQSLPLRGSNCYVRIMMEIEKYKVNRRMQIKVQAFFYKNKRTIFAIFSVVGVLVSILGTLMSLKKRSTV